MLKARLEQAPLAKKLGALAANIEELIQKNRESNGWKKNPVEFLETMLLPFLNGIGRELDSISRNESSNTILISLLDGSKFEIELIRVGQNEYEFKLYPVRSLVFPIKLEIGGLDELIEQSLYDSECGIQTTKFTIEGIPFDIRRKPLHFPVLRTSLFAHHIGGLPETYLHLGNNELDERQRIQTRNIHQLVYATVKLQFGEIFAAYIRRLTENSSPDFYDGTISVNGRR